MFGLSAEELKQRPLPPQSVILRTYHQDFDRSRFGVTKGRALVTSMEAMLILLRSGQYLGYLPAHYARSWVDFGELWPLDLPQMDYKSEHMLITRPSGRHIEILDIFTALLVEEAAVASKSAKLTACRRVPAA